MTLLAIVLAAGFLALALASALAPAGVRLGSWMPLHLVLAGAAPTAIAGVMPFFSAAVSGAPAASPAIRLAGVGGVAVGALLIVTGHAGWLRLGDAAAAAGGLVYLAGLVAVGVATLLPLRSALGPRRLFMGAMYGTAVAYVLIGATLATLLLAGWPPVRDSWATLKPAHAWLNLFGFVSLVIVSSLLHLLPTVAGARIRRTRASIVAFVASAGGPGTVAAGFVARSDPLVLVGGMVTLIGALALGWHALAVVRGRARWTTDHAWHRFTTLSLIGALGWFGVAVVIATYQLAVGGATPAGWVLDPLVAPLAVGWVGQALAGAWSHLLPAVGPGSPAQHAVQRKRLGRLAGARLLLLNGGVLAYLAGQLPVLSSLAGLGLVMIGMAAIGSIALLVAALAVVPGRLSR